MSLCGDDWSFGQARLSARYPAKVPGVTHLDLIANGIIEDPYFGQNERSVQWVDKEDWIYEKTFVPSAELLDSDNIEIEFKGLDTYADVYFNDVKIIEADNMFRTWKADVKPYIKKGENILKVYLHSPIKIDMQKWEKVPNQYRASNDQSENGGVLDRKLSVFARKAGYHYGWDWGPRLVTSGIWRDVTLHGWNDAHILNTHFRQSNVSPKKADVSDVVEIEASDDIHDAVCSVTDKNSGKILARKKCDLKKGLNKITLEFQIKNPKLWWCNGLGKPEMYNLTTTVSLGENINLTADNKVGIRSVKVVTDPDSDGTMQFYFVLNGVPVFGKGANYIPQDNFLPAVTEERYRKTLEDAIAANMNMIRIWGGGIYEDDVFYDICDELGLMVWQDFMFACSMYPATEDWLANVKAEARDNIIRLRNHPSIVIWCGGNECLDAWYNWGWRNRQRHEDTAIADRIENEMNALYFEALPEMMEMYDPDSFYWGNSPFSGKGKGSDGVNGDRHYYGVWQRKFPISQYNDEKAHFFSEYGVQSFPEYSTIMKFAPDSATHRLDSDVMMWHQRGGENANGLIAWYLENEYRKPMDFEEMIYINQLFQGDAMRTAIEAHRRDMPHCMGSLLWQHNDCWPVASWSTRDYYGNWKAAHYLTAHAFEDIIASCVCKGDSVSLYTVSDRVKDSKGNILMTLFSLDGTKIWQNNIDLKVPGNTSTLLWTGTLADMTDTYAPEDVVLNVRIIADGTEHEGNYYFCKQSELKLTEPRINYEITPISGGYAVTLKSDRFVRALNLTLKDRESHFDDNFFDLLPGIPKTCQIRTDMHADELKSRLHMRYLNL